MTTTDDIAFSRPYMGEAEATAAAQTVMSGWIVGGPRLAEFEARFANLCGAKHAVGVSNWTTGAFLVLHAWGIGPGDEVLVPSLTFIATVNVIRHVGATPVFVDITPDTFTIDVDDARSKITSRTRAIMPVDQIGLPCDIDAINDIAAKHDLLVLDDAACAFASRNRSRPIGSLAMSTVFSLHARKIITTAEGGMITTDDADLAARLRILRHQGMSLSDFARHGMPPTVFESYPEVGYNFRITDIAAAIGLAQLDRLDEILMRRAKAANAFTAALETHPFLIPPNVPSHLVHNWQSYQVTVAKDSPLTRNEIMDRLHLSGIPTRRGVMASHRERPYAEIKANLPVTESIADATFQLPMHPGLTDTHIYRIISAMQSLT